MSNDALESVPNRQYLDGTRREQIKSMKSPRHIVQSNNLRQLLDIPGLEASSCTESASKQVDKSNINTMSNDAVQFQLESNEASLDEALSNTHTTR